MTSSPSELLSVRDRALVEAVALRVLALLDERRELPARLVDAAEIARLLGVSRSTVYEHRWQLGAVEVGEGPRPRLRFDPQTALEAWTDRSGSRESQASRSRGGTGDLRRRRRSRLGSGAQLLPINGRSAPRMSVDEEAKRAAQ